MQKKDFPIVFGAKQYLLRFNHSAFQYIEDVTGKAYGYALQDGSLKAMDLILHAGLRQHHPEISLEDIGSLVDEADGLAELKVTLAEAVGNYLVKLSDQPKSETTKKKTVSTSKTGA